MHIYSIFRIKKCPEKLEKIMIMLVVPFYEKLIKPFRMLVFQEMGHLCKYIIRRNTKDANSLQE